MNPSQNSALVWFRRDLRHTDHAALYHALRQHPRVYCLFIFDSDILDALPDRHDRRVDFIQRSVAELEAALRTHGGGLLVRHGRPAEIVPALAQQLGVAAVYANRDYEPAAKTRDAAVAAALRSHGIAWHNPKDQVIFDGDEVLTQTGKPYTVFTPYKKCWLKTLTPFHLRSYPTLKYADRLTPPPAALDQGLPTLAQLGFAATDLDTLGVQAGMSGAEARWADFIERMEKYDRLRDYPAVKGVSYLAPHLRFGTISIRELARLAWERGGAGAETWLSELVWRDFYFMIFDRFPHADGRAFRPEYDALVWDDAPELLAAWQQGRTGYPIVDAAMRQLLSSGYMHNRLRMVTAAFLVKDLGIDWRLGEAWFARHLLDFDLAANNGGWQWSASTGCDAQPWFRIFNPVTQSEKFDPEGRFIRRYVPELAQLSNKGIHAPWTLTPAQLTAAGVRLGETYPAPVVDHATARQRTLARYERIKAGGESGPA